MPALDLPWNEALSGLTGSVSLASWIFLLVPQLWENYVQSSAEGISFAFLLIWFVGDVTNLAGAVWAGLVPTVIALAGYFCVADAVLIGQCVWYGWRNGTLFSRQREEKEGPGAGRERRPLLNGHTVAVGGGEEGMNGYAGMPNGTADANQRNRRKRSLTDITDANLGLPGSRRRRSSAASNTSLQRTRTTSSSAGAAFLARILEDQTPSPPATSTSRTSAILKHTLCVLAIILAGSAGWAVAYKTGAWTPTPPPGSAGDGAAGDDTPPGASLLGYMSAVAYLGARIPQIVKNQRERSCEGLSLLFFLLSLLGNLTYGMGILFHSVEKQYILTNLPWLIGSLGTMAEDAVIFVQFSVFGERETKAEVDMDEERRLRARGGNDAVL
jgi:solute carrier family 66 (lysosomal lysine-arginine transporter), member 1